MGGRRRHLVLLGALAGAGAIALALGAAERSAADTIGPVESCNPDGRLFCLTLSTFEGITASDPSRANGQRFTWVEWQMSNDGGSTLTHPTITVTLQDFCDSSSGPAEPCAAPNPTSAFVLPGSGSPCTLNVGVLTCTYANLPAGGNTGTPTRVYFKTADVPASSTVISVRGTVKERANDTNVCDEGDPNCDTFVATIANSYEVIQNVASTFALNGKPFYLESNDKNSSYSFTSSSPAVFHAEFNTDTSPCPVVSPTCFQRFLEVATVDAPPTYNAGPIVFYARLTDLPSGVNANNVVAIHTYDDSTTQVIGDQSSERSKKGCTFTYSNQIPLPSICAEKVQGVPQTIDVWLWDSGNGRVGWG